MAVRPRALLARLVIAACLATASELVISVPEAHATSLADLSVEQLTDASTYVVRGTITRVWSEVDANQRVWTRAELAVGHVFKGPARPKTLVIDSLGGFHDGSLLEVDQAARYAAGEEIIVFLDTIQFGARLVPVGKFQGKFTVQHATDVDRDVVFRFTAPTRQAYDARFLPAPDASERVYAEELTGRIETRVRAGWDGQPIPGLNADKLREVNAPARRTP